MIRWHALGQTEGKKVPSTMALVSNAKEPAAARLQECRAVGPSECESEEYHVVREEIAWTMKISQSESGSKQQSNAR